MDKIAIIVLNYNTTKETIDCLFSLNKMNKEGFKSKIFVVDNGSKEVFQLSNKFSREDFELIRSEANLGFCGGNNLGVHYSIKNYNPDYFLFLNSDTLVDPNFLIVLHQNILLERKIGIVVPKIYFASGCEYHRSSYNKKDLGKVIWYAGGIIDWENFNTFHFGVDEIDRNQFDKLKFTEFATGCCFLIKRELVENFGCFNERYFLYYEDVELSQRLINKGYKIVFCPQSFIYHVNGASSEGFGGKLQVYYQTRNSLLFFFTYGNWKTKLRIFKLALHFLVQGDMTRKQAVWHFFTQQLGKNNFIK